MKVIIRNELASETWSWMPVKVEVFDHQGFSTISSVSLEAPDLFDGVKELDYDSETDDGGVLYKGWIRNDLKAPVGTCPLLVRVQDIQSDPNLGNVDG